MSPTRASKRARLDTGVADTLRDTPEARTQVTAVSLVHCLMKQFSFDPAKFFEDESEDEVGVCVSNRTAYKRIAPRIGLEPHKAMTDIGTFEIHRSRIPTNLFESIVTDMDKMLMQYGSPFEHKTEDARSRFFSPIFNHLVTLFNFMLRNDPETVTDESDGRVGTKGRIQYLSKTFGAVAILVIEKKLKVRNDSERLEAIAQVIAEIDARDLDNKSKSLGYSLPIHCVFSHDSFFEFFKFERKPNPSFTRGCFPGDPTYLQSGLSLPDLESLETSLPFILKLRSVCETIFDMMLSAYMMH